MVLAILPFILFMGFLFSPTKLEGGRQVTSLPHPFGSVADIHSPVTLLFHDSLTAHSANILPTSYSLSVCSKTPIMSQPTVCVLTK